MAKITGIGGIFLKTNNEPQKLLKWYHEILGLEISEYGINLLEPNVFTLITFEKGLGEAALNFTVDNMTEMMEMLALKNVKIHKPLEDFKYGKFLQILDLYGNVVELWEPKHDAYKKMVEEEIKEKKG